MYQQTKTPNPNVPCKPGYCLKYVQDTFGIAPKYPTAMAAWDASAHKHEDENFPEDVAVPIFFSVAGVPEGHVALRMADGSIYSSSSPVSEVPVHHPSLAAMQQYWGNGTMLTVLGWAEDVEDTLVIEEAPIAVAPSPSDVHVAWVGNVTSKAPFNVRTTPALSGAVSHENTNVGGENTVIAYVKGDQVTENGVTSNVWLEFFNGLYGWSGNLNWTGPQEV